MEEEREEEKEENENVVYSSHMSSCNLLFGAQPYFFERLGSMFIGVVDTSH